MIRQKVFFWKNGDYLASIQVNHLFDEVAELEKASITSTLLMLYHDEVPSDALSKKYRAAWDVVDGQLVVDMAKCKAMREEELKGGIDAQLAAIDMRKTRAISDAILLNDHSKLEELEAEAAALRQKRSGIDMSTCATPADVEAYVVKN